MRRALKCSGVVSGVPPTEGEGEETTEPGGGLLAERAGAIFCETAGEHEINSKEHRSRAMQILLIRRINRKYPSQYSHSITFNASRLKIVAGAASLLIVGYSANQAGSGSSTR